MDTTSHRGASGSYSAAETQEDNVGFWRRRAEFAERRARDLEHCTDVLSCSAIGAAKSSEMSRYLRDVLRRIAATLRADHAHLTRLDQFHQVLQTAALIEDGVDAEHRLPREMPIADDEFYSGLDSSDSFGVHDFLACSSRPEHGWPGATEYHRARGHRYVCAIALRGRDGDTLGHIGLAFRQDPSFSPEGLRLVQGLAQQAALAIELVNLAEETRRGAVDSAVAFEREKAARERAAQLAKANEAMQRAIAGLARVNDLTVFLREMLRSALTVSGAQTGAVTLLRGDHLEIPVLFDRHGLVDRERQERDNLHYSPLSGKLRRFREAAASQQQPWIIDHEPTCHRPEFDEFHRVNGNATFVHLPMYVMGRVIGWLGLAFGFNNEPRNLELLRVLADQMTVAVEMNRLAEESRRGEVESAVARAAEQRAQAVSKLNGLLMESARRLTDDDDPEQFLVYVMGELARVSGADWVFVFRYSCPEEHISLHLRWHNGSIRRGLSGEEFPLLAKPFPSNITPLWQELRQRRDFWYPQEDQGGVPETWIWPGARDWFEREQITDAVHSILLVGDEPVGSIALSFTGERRFRDADWSTVLTLKQQAALALRITSLAERSRELAVAREQERAEQEKESAILEERERLARELHDTLLQGFTGVALQLRALLRRPTAGLEELRSTLTSIELEATRAVQDARFAVTSMRTSGSVTKELVPAMAALVQSVIKDHSIVARSEISGPPRSVSDAVTAALLRIAREAMLNAIRHGQAHRIELRLHFEPLWIHLTIEDDGSGFTPNEEQAVRNGHFGLLGMRERAERAGGRLSLTSSPGMGTRIIVEVPA